MALADYLQAVSLKWGGPQDKDYALALLLKTPISAQRLRVVRWCVRHH